MTLPIYGKITSMFQSPPSFFPSNSMGLVAIGGWGSALSSVAASARGPLGGPDPHAAWRLAAERGGEREELHGSFHGGCINMVVQWYDRRCLRYGL